MHMREKQVSQGDHLDVINPYTGLSVGSVRLDRKADVEATIARVRTYNHHLSAEARKILLARTADALEARRE